MTAEEHEWEVGWEGHAQAQRLRTARLTMIQKLQWLEDAHRVVTHLQKSRSAAGEVRDRSRNEGDS